MKIYVCVDMEGISGIVHPTQLMKGEAMYEEGRRLLTNEVNAVVESLLQEGVREIIVRDIHASGVNFIPERLHPGASYVMGGTLFQERFPGLDHTFDGALLIGYHTMAGVERAVRDHSYSSRHFTSLKLNGRPIGEIGLDSLLLGTYGVPVLLVTGDEATCKEAANELEEVTTYATKVGLGRHSAILKSPVKVHEELRVTIAEALKHRDSYRPFIQSGPYELQVQYMSTDLADAKYCDGKQAIRLDGLTIRVMDDDLTSLLCRAL
ncbi:aminopeptidase [Paenibacillus sp. LMG 31461]|uniref:Aminopeptidase n=1 Tax=Paenibacillus plantarum TaxID=2654975 RepID=A0ABX1XLV5_9BACL|nr:M55 family metallopeptidase [Paenibacillus plantarum]NOU69422.1 aminopeptidase [Paenibacillus plantarum]